MRWSMEGDRGNQLGHAGDREAADLTLGQLAEEALDQVEPRRGGRREVKLDARIAGEPGRDRRMLVRRVGVEDDMDGEAGRDVALHPPEQREEFLLPVLRPAFLQNPPGGHL